MSHPQLRTRIDKSDLALTTQILALLRLLNDPLVGGAKLESAVAAVPILAARLVARACSARPCFSLPQALTLVGNRGIEAELLQLLEELTIMKAYQDEPQ